MKNKENLFLKSLEFTRNLSKSELLSDDIISKDLNEIEDIFYNTDIPIYNSKFERIK